MSRTSSIKSITIYAQPLGVPESLLCTSGLLAQVIGPLNDGRGDTAPRGEIYSPDPPATVH
eukprot:4881225-Pleurochrysis_carterae.AAC.6